MFITEHYRDYTLRQGFSMFSIEKDGHCIALCYTNGEAKGLIDAIIAYNKTLVP